MKKWKLVISVSRKPPNISRGLFFFRERFQFEIFTSAEGSNEHNENVLICLLLLNILLFYLRTIRKENFQEMKNDQIDYEP
jgi:hypothetical protein